MVELSESPSPGRQDSPADALRYEAFISYSHSDKAVAGWLQNALERYRLPKALRRSPDRADRRLRPLFRDDTELASSSDLTASIVSALEQSGALIVVCSPRAAASRWANEEIRTFRRIAPDRPILPLIIDGSPDPQAPDCAFPEALLIDEQGYALPEPLAADLRSHADGKRGALVKLIAGLLGVGVDALRQRDQQRRLRVMTGVTAGALTISLVTIALAVIADRARDEAELRRDQAEGLIEFMLVELRDKLQPIGRLDVLDAVGDEAIEYFSALGELGTDAEVLKRALALRQIGEVRFAEQDLDAAQLAFDQSRGLAQALQERNPEDNEVLFELSQAEFWVGYVDWQRGDLDGAEQAFQQYAKHSQTLFDRDPGDPDYKLELSYAAGNLASLARARGDVDAALIHNNEALRLNEELLADNPGDEVLIHELAKGYSWAGSIWADRGELEASESTFREAVNAFEQLHLGGSDKVHSYEMVNTLALLASAVARRGRITEAADIAMNCGREARALVKHDPENTEWRRALVSCELRSAELFMTLGDMDRAATRLAQADEHLAAVRDDALASERVLRALVSSELAYASGADQAALSGAEETLSLHDRLPDNSVLFRGGVPENQIMALRLLGDASERLGDTQRAQKAWREALDLLQASETASPDYLALSASLYHRLGDVPARDALIAELDAMGYGDPLYRPNF